MKIRTQLSLCDGISGGQIAAERIGMLSDNYIASEIDPYAIKITQKNYPNTIQVGDMNDWRSWDIDWTKVDLVTAGFPCQAWSVAGQQQGDRDPRGQLFWVVLDIMKHVLEHNPNAKYLMENVRMSNAFEEYITFHTEQALPNVNKYLINSALVSAQNRKRFYWTNIEGVEQPNDLNIKLADIIDDDNLQAKVRMKGGRLVGRRLNQEGTRKDYDKSIPIKQTIEVRKDSKTNCLSTVTKDYILVDNLSWRYLKPLECERLQTVPDNFTEGVSNSQRYKMLGNGWTIDVIAHIFRKMNNT